MFELLIGRIVALLSVSQGLTAAIASVSQAVPLDIGGRIVNGTDADIKDYPYMVSLQYEGRHLCGGSIIDENNILTAAHCVMSRDIEGFYVLPGSTSITNGIAVRVDNTIIHPSYTGLKPYRSDIAIVHLALPLEFGEFVQPIQLPRAFEDIPELSDAILTGWGYQMTGGYLQDTLQRVDIKVYSDLECEALHSETGPTSRIFHICAGIPEGGKGQCSGDSGGPLVVRGIQIGIVSWSKKPCTREGYPGVLTKVSTYIDWINCNLKTA